MKYRVEYTSEFNGKPWIQIPGDITASGYESERQDSTRGYVRRFYRVLELP